MTKGYAVEVRREGRYLFIGAAHDDRYAARRYSGGKGTSVLHTGFLVRGVEVTKPQDAPTVAAS